MDMIETRKMLKMSGVTQQDIASALMMAIATVGKYMNNKPISRRSKAEIERYLQDLRLKYVDPRDGPEAA